MTITADGERSRRRLPVAKKALASITDMDLPAKASMFEGFTYKVWQMDKGELVGGWIVSPDGIFVLCATGGKLKQFVCDSYECAALPIFTEEEGGRHIMAPAVVPPPGYYASAVGGLTAAQSIVAYSNQKPFCLPFAGEGVTVAVAGQFETSANNKAASVQVTNCLSNGAADIASPGISEFIYSFGSCRVVPLQASVADFSWLQWNSHVAVPFNDFQDFKVATQLSMTGTEYAAAQITGSEIYPDAPQQYWDTTAANLYAIGSGPTPRNIGTYAIALPETRGIAAFFTPFNYPISGLGEITPATAAYRVTLSFFDIGATANAASTVTFDVLEPLLHQLMVDECPYIPEFTSTGTAVYNIAAPSDNYIAGDQCAGMLGHILGGPADGWLTSVRNVTFADALGVVYSWSRYTDPDAVQYGTVDIDYPGRLKNGGFKFVSVIGFERIALFMPSLVLENASYDPWITLLTDSAYLCLAHDIMTDTIKGVFVGSPFVDPEAAPGTPDPITGELPPVAWEGVALPLDADLVAVRPTNPAASAAAAEFIAVGKMADGYHIFLRKTGVWHRLSKLPIDETPEAPLYAKWDICPFGSGAAVDMLNIRQFPVAI